jgi:outer membrane protein assembly factor BamB
MQNFTLKAPSTLSRLVGYISALVLSLVLAGCAEKNQWDTYQEPVVPIDLPKSVEKLRLDQQWRENTGAGASDGFALLKPQVFEGSVFVASRKGKVSRIELDSGKVTWQVDVDGLIYSGVAVDDIVVVALDNSEVIAFDVLTGDEIWRVTQGKQISSIPLVASGRVVIRTSDGSVYGYDSDTGTDSWQYQRTVGGLSVHGDPAPVVSGEGLITGFTNARIVVSNIFDGRVYWEKALSITQGGNEIERLDDVDSPPLIVLDTLYAANYQGDIVAMQLQNATELWRNKVSTRLAIHHNDGVLFVTDTLGNIIAIDALDGETLWQQDALQGYGLSHPVTAGGYIYIGDQSGNIYQLNQNTGQLLARKSLAGDAIVSLSAVGDDLLVYTVGGELSLQRF